MKSKKHRFDPDVKAAILSDPEYAAEYFAELSTRPLPVQAALLRRLTGMTQEKLARGLGLRQTHVSRLEKEGSDHRLSLYRRVAEQLGARLVMVPKDMVLVPRRSP